MKEEKKICYDKATYINLYITLVLKHDIYHNYALTFDE